MTIYDFETGTDGQSATLASTGGGIAAGSGNTVTNASGDVISGSLALKVVMGTTAAFSIDYHSPISSTAQGTTWTNGRYTNWLMCIKIPVGGFGAATGGFTTLMQVYGGSTTQVTLGRLQVSDKSGGVSTVRYSNSSASQLATITGLDLAAYEGQWVAFRGWHDTGTTATSGAGEIRFYANPYASAGSTPTNVATFTGWDQGSITGTHYPIARVRPGIVTIQLTGGRTTLFDYIAVDGTATAAPQWITAPTAGALPNATITSSSTVPAVGDTITLTLSNSSGTTSRTVAVAAPPSGTWSNQPAYPDGTTPPTITTPTALTSTTVTGLQPGITWLRRRETNGSGTSDAYLAIFTHPLNNADVGVQDSVLTGYTNEGGASTPEAALNDALDSTFQQGPSAPTSAAFTTDLMQPFGAGAITINCRYRQVNDVGDTSTSLAWFLNVYKEDGTTLVDSFAWTSAPGQSGVWQNFPCVLDAPGLAAIPGLTDRKALVVKKWSQVA